MQPLLQQEPAWKTTPTYRLGAQYRSNEGRILHIKDLGWFVRMRGEFHSVCGLTTSHGIAGPFISQEHALAYLHQAIWQEQPSPISSLATHPDTPI